MTDHHSSTASAQGQSSPQAEAALRQALANLNAKAPRLSDAFYEQALSRLDGAATPSVTPTAYGVAARPSRRRLVWPAVAVAALLAGLAFLISTRWGDDAGNTIARRPAATHDRHLAGATTERPVGGLRENTATQLPAPISPSGAGTAVAPAAVATTSAAPTLATATLATAVADAATDAMSAAIAFDSIHSDTVRTFHIDPAIIERTLAEAAVPPSASGNASSRSGKVTFALNYGSLLTQDMDVSSRYDADIVNLQSQSTEPLNPTPPDNTGEPTGLSDYTDHSDQHDATSEVEPGKDKGDNGHEGGSHTHPPTPLDPASGDGNPPTDQSPYKYSTASESYSHRLPLSFGFSVRIPLGKRLAVETGLTYSYLRSSHNRSMTLKSDLPTEKVYSLDLSTTQHVHYLGIPLHLQVMLFDRRRWQCYASAGVQMFVPVSASRHGWQLDLTAPGMRSYGRESVTTPLQWAMGAGLGLQFNISRHLGVYIQPSIQWYKPNGSSIETYHTKHPLQFALPIGVRITL